MIYNKEKCLASNTQNELAGLKMLDVIDEESFKPVELMNELLFKIIRDNENSEYGKKYHFADIKTVKDFQRNVPIVTHNDIKPYIDRMVEGEENVLTSYSVKHFNVTSATSGKEKYVPMSEKQQVVYLKYNFANANGVLGRYIDPKWKNGRAMNTSEGHCITLPSGLTAGGASAKVVEFLKKGNVDPNEILTINYTTPLEAMISSNGVDRAYVILRFSLIDKEMTGIITPFMSQLVHIMTYLAKNYKVLVDDIENGTVCKDFCEDDAKKRIQPYLKKNPERANELREIFKESFNIIGQGKIDEILSTNCSTKLSSPSTIKQNILL